jgi:hypothetical protein
MSRPAGSARRGVLGEGELHVFYVGLADADDAGVLPHRNVQHRLERRSAVTHHLDSRQNQRPLCVWAQTHPTRFVQLGCARVQA